MTAQDIVGRSVAQVPVPRGDAARVGPFATTADPVASVPASGQHKISEEVLLEVDQLADERSSVIVEFEFKDGVLLNERYHFSRRRRAHPGFSVHSGRIPTT